MMVLDDRKKEIILMMAECDMKYCTVAKRLYLHWNTVFYHMNKIEQITGLNPRKFYDLIELVKMVKDGDG